MSDENSSILADMVLLYELSLSIGTSLDMEENSGNFLKALLSRKNLDYAAVWIFDDTLPETQERAGIHLRFALPEIYVHDEWLERTHPFASQMGANEQITFDVTDTEFVHCLKSIDSGSVALFRLGNIGILELCAQRFHEGFPKKDLFQIRDLIRKFTFSLQACLSNERNLWEIQQRIETEAQLRNQRSFAEQIMKKMGQGLITSRLDGTTEYVNPAFVAFMEADKQDLIDHNLLAYVDEADQDKLRRNFISNCEGHIAEYTLSVTTLKGTKRYAQVSSVPRWDADKVIGVITVITDLTKQKQIEDNLADARDQALRTSQLKSEFLATMSHEIRTPMNGIIGMTELLLETSLTDEQQDFAQIVRGEAHSLLKLINEILDFSKIEAGKMELDPSEFSLRELIEGIGEMLGSRLPDNRIALMTYVDPQIPEKLYFDESRLRQVIMNLAGNAVKFTKEGEVNLQVHLLDYDPNKNWVSLRFEVQDTGIGIPANVQEHIFNPFQQADGSTTRRYGGTGLGLTIARSVVDFFGGNLRVESQVDKGSMFWFEIDIDVPSYIGDPLTTMANQSIENKRILVVDDSEVHRFILSTYLRSLGAVVISAHSGQDGIEKLQSEQEAFDILFVDWFMPGMDGFEFYTNVKRLHLKVPPKMVLMTSYGETVAKNNPALIRFDGHLAKPLAYRKLEHLVEKLLNQNRPVSLSRMSDRSNPPAELSDDAPLILLVENNLTNQRVLERQLGRLGYQVQLAENGLEGVEIVQKNPEKFDLILMDCQMPVMDGYDATETIRKLDIQQPPIIAITANALVGDREKCIAAGMDDYISKPIQLEALKRMLTRWLEK